MQYIPTADFFSLDHNMVHIYVDGTGGVVAGGATYVVASGFTVFIENLDGDLPFLGFFGPPVTLFPEDPLSIGAQLGTSGGSELCGMTWVWW